MRGAVATAAMLVLGSGAWPSATEPPKAIEWREEFHTNGALKLRVPVRGGLREGVEHQWHADGRLASVRVFRHDELHGLARSWYGDGSPHEERWYDQGRERGAQRARTPEGALYLNYEVRAGRRFGLVNAKPCLPAKEGM